VDINAEIDKVSSVDIEDLPKIKMTIDKTLHPDKTKIQLHDEYDLGNPDTNANNKIVKVTKTMKYVKTKYPEIFKPFRDTDIINMGDMVKDLRDMALNPINKVADRIKAHKVILDTAVQAEKFSKDKQTGEQTLETMAFEDKTYADIIKETRAKYVD
jgi:putative cell wall-binding protein